MGRGCAHCVPEPSSRHTMNFAAVLETIDNQLRAEGYPVALVGGLALASYGITRATLDLGLLVPGDAQDTVIGLMEELGYETLHRSSGYSNHLHRDDGLGRVDFVYVRGETRDAIFDGALRVEGPGGVAVHVPRPEHLAAMKVLAMKNDPACKLQELADISALLHLPDVDAAEIRRAFERHGMLASWNELDR